MEEMLLPAEKMTPLYRLRHSLSHILAQAVLTIRPDAKMGFGPPVDNGFYYDFDFGDNPISESDFKQLEETMQRIIKEKQQFEHLDKPVDVAVAELAAAGQKYKAEYAQYLADNGYAPNGTLSFYRNGPFLDMCEGPHLGATNEVPKATFKLDKLAGAYWRGSEKNPMLTRIYGLAFPTPAELKDYIEKRELARQRDHRKLGKELDLFEFDEEVGSGLPLWLPKGTVIREELEKWAKETEFKAGYQRVSTPAITREQLYYTSGHLPYYKESMFPPMELEDEDRYYLRPMNCPHHHKVFATRMRSYRDLPLRLAEYGNTYRYEKRGSLSGLMRVRAMCMNDAHIYCSPADVKQELKSVIEMYKDYYSHLRLGDFRVRLSLHAKDNDKFVDQEAEWLRSEEIVREVLNEMNIGFEEEAGEAAFYGPKIDIQLKNVMGKEETVSTCQLDFVMADRFGLEFNNAEGGTTAPYIIHRAPLSTHERMVSFLIEIYGGAFPTWLSPNQVQLIPVNETVIDYTKGIEEKLRANLIRAEVDLSSDSFNKKVRNAVTSKNPNIWVIGSREAEEQTITWRRYASKDQVTLPLSTAIETLIKMRDSRLMDNFADVALPVTA
ncbi:threonine--tRNA ligase [Mucilaginibacter sp. L3T2-6]|uniref:threonine--tRNA ligase n=2 Tax=Mucilaginibacter sp. L3T2-6 TaxID=3062491 RepID=UPI00270B69A3|nr:threonine--tRNA ligase [Mucilaginibacter sp. L3T2-6]MDO3643238.1 threonine--tRNA ligase [Mucilaginibacter sp. L3T2-6]MDV6215562.1 threonine--tRNA ligase [Mucilaginibacter sp. L3T2-6]